MLSRRGWAFVCAYIAVMGWLSYRALMGWPVAGTSLLARLGG